VNKKIILPSKDGIANLDIRRVQSELESSSKIVMDGYMPADLVVPAVEALKAVITAIERGEVSSLCVVAVMPMSSTMQAGSAFVSTCGNEVDKIDDLFHFAMQKYCERMPPDEAG